MYNVTVDKNNTYNYKKEYDSIEEETSTDKRFKFSLIREINLHCEFLYLRYCLGKKPHINVHDSGADITINS